MDGENDPLNLHSGDAPADRFRKIREELEAMQLPELRDEELEARVQAGGVRPAFPDVPDLEGVVAKGWETKTRHEAVKRQVQQRQKLEQDSASGLRQGLTLVYTIVGLPLLGFGLGLLLDLWLKTMIFRAFGALIGATAGVAIAIVQVNHTNKTG